MKRRERFVKWLIRWMREHDIELRENPSGTDIKQALIARGLRPKITSPRTLRLRPTSRVPPPEEKP